MPGAMLLAMLLKGSLHECHAALNTFNLLQYIHVLQRCCIHLQGQT